MRFEVARHRHRHRRRERRPRCSSRSRRPTARPRASYGGTGLGLAISQAARRADGRRDRRRERARRGQRRSGSRSRLGAPAEAARRRRRPRRGSRAAACWSSTTTRPTARSCAQQLARWGMRVTRGRVGGRARSRCCAGRAQRRAASTLAILDMQMPEMDGLALARAIKADPALADAAAGAADLARPARRTAPRPRAIGIAALPDEAGRRRPTSTTAWSSVLGGRRAAPSPRRSSTRHSRARAAGRPRRARACCVAEDNAVNQKVARAHAREARATASTSPANGARGARGLRAAPLRPRAHGLPDAGDGRLRGDRARSASARRRGAATSPIIAMTAQRHAGRPRALPRRRHGRLHHQAGQAATRSRRCCASGWAARPRRPSAPRPSRRRRATCSTRRSCRT